MSESFAIASTKRTESPALGILEMHTHDTYEIFLFLEGDADYHVEGAVYQLNPGDILVTKKAESHSLMIKTQAPYERMVVRFNAEAILGDRQSLLCSFLDDRPLGQHNLYPAALFADKCWAYYIQKMCAHKRDQSYVQLYLTVLLNELYEAYPQICRTELQRKDLVSEVIDYINNHYSEPISVNTLCSEFYISRAQLNRRFRKRTGSSVWEYVVAKRLLCAKALLENGETPASACIKCGFNDYSPFYRAYKARFGVSPKADRGTR